MTLLVPGNILKWTPTNADDDASQDSAFSLFLLSLQPAGLTCPRGVPLFTASFNHRLAIHRLTFRKSYRNYPRSSAIRMHPPARLLPWLAIFYGLVALVLAQTSTKSTPAAIPIVLRSPYFNSWIRTLSNGGPDIGGVRLWNDQVCDSRPRTLYA